MPATQTTWAVRTVTQDDTRARLRTIAEEDAAKTAPKGSPAQLTGDFYAACMDESRINAAGLKPLDPMLKQVDDPAQIVPRWKVSAGLWDMYFWVDDVAAIYRELTARGAKIDYGLCDQPYGCREFGIQDLDGHDVGFGQEMT